jgi:hypothetical protein
MFLIENPWFDRFIMTCILLNSLVMSSFDFENDNRCTYLKKTSYCLASD